MKMNESFGSKIRAARKAKGLTQAELAEKMNTRNTVISNWENNINKPDVDSIEYLCGILNITPSFLLGPFNSNNSNIFSIQGLQPLPKMKRVPVLGKIACGVPILAEQNFDGYVNVPGGVEADFSLQCQGDSMVNARILDGDMVFIRQQPDVENGEIAAVLIGNEATLKRVYKQDGKLTLMPENSSYPPFTYSGPELENVRILGKAVAFISAVR